MQLSGLRDGFDVSPSVIFNGCIYSHQLNDERLADWVGHENP